LEGYREDDALGGFDMYSSSKACVEIMSSAFRRSFLNDESSMAMATARAGNVIGGGDWAKDRLIPDCIKSINSGEKIEIRNPDSVRPWQFVLEPLHGYLLLGQKLSEDGKKFAESFNFGPDENCVMSVNEVAKRVIKYYNKGEIIVKKSDELHEAGLLMLNTEKSRKTLGWKPVYDTETAVQKTAEWYKMFYEKETDMLEYTLEQIIDYERSVK